MSFTQSSALTVQGRVIFALILREIHTLYGNTHLGYLWAVIQTIFGICVFWGMRAVLGFSPPNGLGIVVFLLCGFIPWYMFSHIVTRCVKAESANEALLTFPQVTPLDLMLGRTIVVWGTQIASALVIVTIALLLDEPMHLHNPLALAASIVYAPLFGLGVGLLCVSLTRFWPTFERVVPMLLRILFFVSGIFFSVSSLPGRFSSLLLLNPIAQIIEWQRYAFSSVFVMQQYSVIYISVWCSSCLFAGLLLERYTRTKVQS